MHGNRKVVEWEAKENGCYECTSHSKDKDGYAKYYKHGVKIGVHKHIYQECFGEVPEEMLIRHTCDNPSCINPEHLILGTNRDNKDDMLKRNRTLKHEQHPGNKLTWDDVYKIRQKIKNGSCTQEELAKRYNVSQTCISKIATNKTWCTEGE